MSESARATGLTLANGQGPAGAAAAAGAPERRSMLSTVGNFRDVSSACGRSVPHMRRGVLFRSATPAGVGQEESLVLVNSFGLQTIVDFRDGEEAARDPGQRLLDEYFSEVERIEELLREMELQEGQLRLEEAAEEGMDSESAALLANDRLRRQQERRQLEDELHERRRSLHHAASAAEDYIATHDSGITVESNDGYLQTAINGPGPARIRRQRVRSPYTPQSKMKRVLVSMLSVWELLQVACLYLAGLFVPRYKAEARSRMIKRVDQMGLLGLYKIILVHSGTEIANVLKIVADRRRHPILLHCSHGKDRTGLTVALILSVLGATPEEIVEDYHISEAHGLSPEGQSHFARHPEMDPQHWGSAPRQVMVDTLAFINDEFGSVHQYLTSIGFDATWQQRLRLALMDDEV